MLFITYIFDENLDAKVDEENKFSSRNILRNI